MKNIIFLSISLFCSLALISCSTRIDYSGRYKEISGDCSSKFMSLKKVQGFADKYYLVIIHGKNQTGGKGKEFLGVIKGNIITVKAGTITIMQDRLHVVTRGKNCIYQKIE